MIFPLTSMKVSLEVSMEVHLLPWKQFYFHGKSVEASVSFHTTSHTSTYFHDYHELPDLSTTSIRVHRDFRLIYFHGRFHQLLWKSISFHGRFHLSRWKQIFFHGDVHGSWKKFPFMEVCRRFHASRWKFPLSVEVEASIAFIKCGVRE